MAMIQQIFLKPMALEIVRAHYRYCDDTNTRPQKTNLAKVIGVTPSYLNSLLIKLKLTWRINYLHKGMYKVNKNGCWIWQGPLNDRKLYGYAGTEYKNGRKLTIRAHNLFYETYIGKIPEGLELDHTCKHGLCVNPEHLEPVTRKENVWRRDSNKLTIEDARELRRLYDKGKTRYYLCAKFNITLTQVGRILSNKCWIE